MLNGGLPVDRIVIALYANSALPKTSSHCRGCSCTKHRNIFPNVRLTTSVWPSVCGLYTELKHISVPNFHSSRHKWLMNFTSRSEVRLRGTPCNRTISSKKWCAITRAFEVFLQDTKWAIFENLSTTTMMESFPLFVCDRPSTKSKLRSSQIESGMGNDLCFANHPYSFDIYYSFQPCEKHLCEAWAKKKWDCSCRTVLSLPVCATNAPPWASLIRCCLHDDTRMHNKFCLNKYPWRTE